MVRTEHLARLAESDSGGPLPHPVLQLPVPPALVLRILGRRRCQSAGSADLATDLQSTQAVKAA